MPATEDAASFGCATKIADTLRARADQSVRLGMPRTRKSKEAKGELYASFLDTTDERDEDSELPRDEVGRRKIKRQYEELLGIRIEKLKGRVLNRERISKTVEGVYFICTQCVKVCHSLDEGLVEDPTNESNRCKACASAN